MHTVCNTYAMYLLGLKRRDEFNRRFLSITVAKALAVNVLDFVNVT